MDIRPIRTAEDHAAALRRIEALWDAEENTPEGDELERLVDLSSTTKSATSRSAR